MTKVVLIRHGESVWNKENLFTGWADVTLSEKGIEEMCADSWRWQSNNPNGYEDQ